MELRRNIKNEERKETFEKIVRNNTSRIYKMIYNMTNNYEIAKELTQEVFTKAWKGFEAFRGESSIYTWLYRIALNTVFKYRKDKIYEKNIISLEDVVKHPTNESNPEKFILKSSDENLIKNLIKSLPKKHQEVLILRYYENCDYSTISEILQIPIGTVRSRLNRTISKLEKLLKEKI
ncbi:MAG: sigma-70 family RNA polymerase sigma factor [candidate division WOR-3 bacterium]